MTDTNLQILLNNHNDVCKSVAEDFRHHIGHIFSSSQNLKVLQKHCLLLCVKERNNNYDKQHFHLTLMMTSVQVVAMSVTVINNSPFQDYPHPDDHTT